jgi:uncharacterized tellurite resistance protein B-like protein
MGLMHILLMFFLAMLLALIAHHFMSRIPRLPRTGRDWGSAGTNDPRVAVAAMMYAVATEDSPLTPEKERRILALLGSTVGLGPDLARTCLTGGRRLAGRLRGDLNSRLHQLLAPIAYQCSPEEKQDVISMLQDVAGSSAERFGPVREGIGRLSSSLLHG